MSLPVAYGYNDAGLRTSTAATIDGVADYVDEYAYDCEGRLVSIAQYGAAGSNAVADKQITLGYNDQGLLATVARYTDGNLAVLAQYSYDSAGRLTALVYSQGAATLASYAWAYGDTNSPLPLAGEGLGVRAESAFAWLPSGGLMPGQDTGTIVDALWEGTGTPASLITEITSLDGTVSYSYDSAGQLLAATYTTGQAAEVYSYDAAGNRLTANGAAYLTGPNNQLLFDGVYSYSYDSEGNRTARFIDVNANGLLDAGDTSVTTYAWDHRKRLTRVTDYAAYGDPATRAIDYLYDTENRWIGRDVDLDGDGQIDSQTRFIYDGNQIVLQFDRAIAPPDDPADPLAEEHLSHRYLWNPAAVDQLMADEQVTDPDVAGDIRWPLADHQGTIRDLAVYDAATDTTTVANHRTFDAYGNLQSQTNPAVDCLFAFTGRPLDQATDLQNNLHRWYDPAVGRWMSEDPIGFEGRDGNLYAYVGNGPVILSDATGTKLAFCPGVTDRQKLNFYRVLLLLGDAGGDIGKALVVDLMTGEIQINVEFDPTKPPNVTDLDKPRKRHLVLPDHPGYLVPPETRMKNAQDTLRKIESLRHVVELWTPVGSTGSPDARNALAALRKTFLANAAKEDGPLYQCDPMTAAVVILGHELGHAIIGLHDPGSNPRTLGAEWGGNVTLVENPLRALFGIPARETQNGIFKVPDRRMFEIAQDVLPDNPAATQEFILLYLREQMSRLLSPQAAYEVAKKYAEEYKRFTEWLDKYRELYVDVRQTIEEILDPNPLSTIARDPNWFWNTAPRPDWLPSGW